MANFTEDYKVQNIVESHDCPCYIEEKNNEDKDQNKKQSTFVEVFLDVFFMV